MRRIHLTSGVIALALGGCGNSAAPNVLEGIPAIVYIQRGPTGLGNVFDYTGGGDGANLFTLTPPTASGVHSNAGG